MLQCYSKAAYNLHTLGLKLTDDSINVSPCLWLLVIGIILCPTVWLGSPKDLKYVQFFRGVGS